MKKWGIIGAGLFLIICVILWYYSPWKNVYVADETEAVHYDNEETLPIPDPTIEYGIIVDSFSVQDGKVQRNENLATIFSKYNISNQTIYDITQKGKGIFDPRRIARGNNYKVYCNNDSAKSVCYFIYEEDPINYIIFGFQDSLNVYKFSKDIDTVTVERSGVITTSLYVDMINNGASPLLVNELADIFGWEIDFFRVNKGDSFKVIYDEFRIDSQLVDIGRVHGAYFNNYGKSSYAIYFEQDSVGDYFDTAGYSLQRSLLRYPIKFSRISSRYSGKRYHPVLKRYKSHLGTDFAAPTGTPIRSVGTGIIDKAGFTRGNGNYVKVRHNSTYSTQYLHMSRIAKGIRTGVKVKQGQLIGYVGSTGLATGPHLCYRFWKNGVQVDALRVNLPPATPVKEGNLARYNTIKEKMIARLDNI